MLDASEKMVKIKTNELIGAPLNWTVHFALHGECVGYAEHEYAYDWAHGGPIIEREWICVDRLFNNDWCAAKRTPRDDDSMRHMKTGPTPLIVAMRCYVASELGDEVEIPEGICN